MRVIAVAIKEGKAKLLQLRALQVSSATQELVMHT